MLPPEPTYCTTEGCARNIEGLVCGDLWAPLCPRCIAEYEKYEGKIRRRETSTSTDRGGIEDATL